MSITFLSKLRSDLQSNGMFENQALEVLDRMIKAEHEAKGSMASRWNDDVEGYPEGVYTVLWLTCKHYALQYIDDVCPAAWFRPCFLPPAEQEAFIKEQKAAAFANYCGDKGLVVNDGLIKETVDLTTIVDPGTDREMVIVDSYPVREIRSATPVEVSLTPDGIETGYTDVVYDFPDLFLLDEPGVSLSL